MEKTYQPENIERQWYENWESKGYFRPSGEGDSYSIAIPPPNVTGSLHMGHAFQHTIMDTLCPRTQKLNEIVVLVLTPRADKLNGKLCF